MEAVAKQRILLTGGTGFIGANLALRLVSQGHQVSILTRESSDRTRLKGLEGKLKFLIADLLDARAVLSATRQIEPNVVYHLASTPFNPPTISSHTHMQVIAMGTLNLLEALVGSPTVRVIYTGSGAEYGSGSQLREESAPAPHTVIGTAKAAATGLMQTYARLYGMEAVVLRLFTPYGPQEDPARLIPHTILSALKGRDVAISSGKQQRDYLYVDDVIEALLIAANRPLASGGILNISSGQGTPVAEVARLTLELMGNPVKLLVGALPTRPDEIWECSGDNAKSRRLLGWQPHTSLEEGLRKTIAWFTQNHQPAGTLSLVP